MYNFLLSNYHDLIQHFSTCGTLTSDLIYMTNMIFLGYILKVLQNIYYRIITTCYCIDDVKFTRHDSIPWASWMEYCYQEKSIYLDIVPTRSSQTTIVPSWVSVVSSRFFLIMFRNFPPRRRHSEVSANNDSLATELYRFFCLNVRALLVIHYNKYRNVCKFFFTDQLPRSDLKSDNRPD